MNNNDAIIQMNFAIRRQRTSQKNRRYNTAMQQNTIANTIALIDISSRAVRLDLFAKLADNKANGIAEASPIRASTNANKVFLRKLFSRVFAASGSAFVSMF